ncbi:MAG TPA: hypothetical protein VMM58_08545 [Bacteroidota bacterium]|nr:hypothetical protein [Bacteroidota bacterium]
MLFLKWYLQYRFPKYKRAYRLAFDPEGFHHYPSELKAEVEGKTQEELISLFVKTLQTFIPNPEPPQAREAIIQFAAITLALPQILDMTVQMIDWRSLANTHKKSLIALIAYLMNSADIIPEGSLGSGGLADDALFAAIVYSSVIVGTSEGFVTAFWKGDRSVIDALCHASETSRIGLPKFHIEVVRAFQNVFV